MGHLSSEHLKLPYVPVMYEDQGPKVKLPGINRLRYRRHFLSQTDRLSFRVIVSTDYGERDFYRR